MTSRRESRLVSVAEAAKYVGASERTVRRFIARGEMTTYKLGARLVRIDLDEVDRLLVPVRGGVG